MKNIKKRLLSGVVAGIFILLPGFKGKAEFKGTNVKASTQSETYIYTRDNYNSGVISNLKINEEVFSLFETTDFDLINYNDQLGFIDKNLINKENA